MPNEPSNINLYLPTWIFGNANKRKLTTKTTINELTQIRTKD